MQPAVLIRLQPAGPWRYGPSDGGQDRLDAHFRSDRLYSALTLAMKQLGWLDEWLDATAKSASPLAFTSLFPYQATTLFVTPPATLWPPPAALLTTPSPVFLSKIRWDAAPFVPVSLVETILLGQSILADQWLPDPESGCLLRRDRLSATPFRTVVRTRAAIDRLSFSSAALHTSACVEFEPSSGLWTLVRFRDEAARSDWSQRVTAAFRLLADTGFGGKRSSGWGQTEAPEFREGEWPGLLFPKLTRALEKLPTSDGAETDGVPRHWLLSLFSPAPSDQVDWSGGEYRVLVRGGFVEGGSATKKQVRMIAEGSVLTSPAELLGTAVDVAPEGFPHPVYRSGIAVSLPLPKTMFTVPDTTDGELNQILSELESAAAKEEKETTPAPQPVEELLNEPAVETADSLEATASIESVDAPENGGGGPDDEV